MRNIEKAKELVSKGKYKKALLLLNKNNKKNNLQTYLSLELEGICLIQEKKYQLAELVLQKSLEKAENEAEKINTLTNLKSSAYSRKDIPTTIYYLKKIIQIDPSSKTAELRLQLCQISFLDEKYKTVLEYSTKLFGLSEYAYVALYITFGANVKLKQVEEAFLIYPKLLVEVDLFSSAQIKSIVEWLFELEKNAEIEHLLSLVENKYSHEEWFVKAINPYSKTSKIEKSLQNIEKPPQVVVGENKKVVLIIKELINKLESLGATFHKELRFIEKEGNLSIKAFVSEGEIPKLMHIPIKAMPLLNDYIFTVENNVIKINKCNTPLSAESNQIMQLMVKLYNETNKIQSWSKVYPLLVLKNHPLFVKLLFKNSKYSHKLNTFLKMYEAKEWDKLALQSFLGSREFHFSQKLLSKAGINTKNKYESGLLTVVDFLNHKVGQNGYIENDKFAALEICTQPDSKTKEVFVQYNFIDVTLTYLIYGFVDTTCPSLFSAITTLKTLTGLEINVLGAPGRINREMAEEIPHLDKYMPSAFKRDNKVITVNNLTIPNRQAKNTLEQVLKIVLLKCDMEGAYQNSAFLNQEIKHIEKQLLLNNLHYWLEVQEAFSELIKQNSNISDIAKNDIVKLCDFSIKHINNYMKANQVITL
ncbi:MAG: hypothetical protein P8I03_04815 [Thalassotalea sp.]|nr:hypothetical protein [Thalassotalea sp.]